MKKFEFSLVAVLKLRQEKEDLARKELVAVVETLQRLLEELERIKKERGEVEAEFRKKQQEAVQAEDLPIYLDYLQMMRTRMERKQDEIMKTQNIVELKRQAVIKAQQQKKMIENIKDKQYAAWQEAIEKKETEALNDLATIRFTRDKMVKHE